MPHLKSHTRVSNARTHQYKRNSDVRRFFRAADLCGTHLVRWPRAAHLFLFALHFCCCWFHICLSDYSLKLDHSPRKVSINLKISLESVCWRRKIRKKCRNYNCQKKNEALPLHAVLPLRVRVICRAAHTDHDSPIDSVSWKTLKPKHGKVPIDGININLESKAIKISFDRPSTFQDNSWINREMVSWW